MNPFRISCTTCHARLKITDPTAIGQILGCPKCGSMVQIVPPADWSPDGPALADSTTLADGRPLAKATSVVGPSGIVVGKAKGATKAVTDAAAGLPPPLPPHPLPGSSPVSRATGARVPVDLPGAVESSARWFWPALSAGTLLSLAVAGLLLYLDQKNHQTQIEAGDTAARQSAPSAASAAAPAKSAENNSDSPVVARSPDHAAPATATPPVTAASPDHVTPPPVVARSPDHATPLPDVARSPDHVTPAPATPAKSADPSKNASIGKAAAPQTRSAAAPALADTTPHDPPVKDPPLAKPPPAGSDLAMPDPPAGRPLRPSVERIPPRVVDVESHLTDPLAAVNFHEVPLVQLLAELSQWSTIPITLDADACSELNVSPDVLVIAQLKDTTIAGVLDEALVPLELSYSVANHQLLIGRPRQGEFRRVRYGVSDLAGDSADGMTAFAALVHAMVEPAGWKEVGGSGASRWVDGALVVEQSESAHTQLLMFCEKLRIARGLPLRSKIDPARFRLEPRSAAAKAALSQPVTVNYARPEPLTRILAYLHSSTQVTLLVDHVALADQRMSADTEGLLTADHQPLGQALTALLEPMDLTWRVVGNRAIEITTPQSAARHAEVEFYPAGELLAGETTGEALVARIQRELAAAAASDPSAPRAAIHFDARSRCLIVRAPQSVQLRVASLLSGLRVARQ